MAVSRVKYDNVNMSVNKSFYSVKYIGGNTNACTAKKSSLGILGSERILDSLLNIFNSNKSF